MVRPGWWLLAWLAALPVQAHLLPAQQGTVNVKGDAAYLAVSLPVSALQGFDDDADHRLSLLELQRHHDSLREQVDAAVQLSSPQGPGQTVRLDLMLSPGHEDRPDLSEQLLVLKHVRFPASPDTLTLQLTRWGAHPSAQRIAVKASRGDDTEAAELSVDHPVFVFFRTRGQALWDHVLVGAEHVLGGADHLLFLLTIGVVGVGWRYLVGVITAFTVAHSITLAAGAMGWVQASPLWVEPLIAASIVVMAWDNLRQPQRLAGQRIALVFACGLLHGLGFAAAVSEVGSDRRHLVTRVLGFNLGIELGQLLFLSLVALLGWALRRCWPDVDRERFSSAFSGVALLTGLYWLVERIWV